MEVTAVDFQMIADALDILSPDTEEADRRRLRLLTAFSLLAESVTASGQLHFIEKVTDDDPEVVSMDPWADDPDYSADDWRMDVINGDTRLSYHQWVAHQREADSA